MSVSRLFDADLPFEDPDPPFEIGMLETTVDVPLFLDIRIDLERQVVKARNKSLHRLLAGQPAGFVVDNPLQDLFELFRCDSHMAGKHPTIAH